MLAVLGLAVLGAILLAANSAAEPEDAPLVQATASQLMPSHTAPPGPRVEGPKPNATSLAQLTAIVGYYGNKPPPPNFEGELNGITFGPIPPPPSCPSDLLYGTAGAHGTPLLRNSGLDFIVAIVPPGYVGQIYHPMSSTEKGPVSIILCDHLVTTVNQHWRSSADDLTISRRLAQPYFPGSVTPERLDAITISGRPAVVIRPRYQGEEVFLLMRDDSSFWTIQSKTLTPDVLIEIANSITTP